MAGHAVIRVVHRLKNAQLDCNLDLSACDLMHVPDAVFLMLRDTPLETANLSNNCLRKLPAKFAIKFNEITELSLHGNQVISLPNEFGDLARVTELDLSDNEFVTIPDPVYKMSGLRRLKVNNNNIREIDIRKLTQMQNLEEINLQDNPLTDTTRRMLEELDTRRLVVTYTKPEIPSSYDDID